MESFFAKPTPDIIAKYIYCQVVLTHETGGRMCCYEFPSSLSLNFVYEVIERLSEVLHDFDGIELHDRYVTIDWS